VQLEQGPLPSGRVGIAAPAGAHDDHAMAVLALVNHLSIGPVLSGPLPMIA